MSQVSAQMQTLARRLLACQVAHKNVSGAGGEVAVHVIEELRLILIRLVGIDGFRSLLSRALALARVEDRSLEHVHLGGDDLLKGFDQTQSSQAMDQAGEILLSHLLELLVTFIGEPLTLRLVNHSWPEATPIGDAIPSGVEPKTEDTP